jgi:hypothetical protein
LRREQLLKDHPGSEAVLDDARISGSPLHLVAARIAEHEAAAVDHKGDAAD